MARIISKIYRQFLKTKLNVRSYSSDDTPKFPGAKTSYTEKLEFVGVTSFPALPTYRVIDCEGKVVNTKENDVTVDKDMIIKMYQTMILLHQMDTILLDAQRQGRISFYMTNCGEEASHVGSAAALDLKDLVFAQYREVGMLLWRGYNVEQIMHQCYGTMKDFMKGKMMPMHHGSRDANVVTISSPLATQAPQAAGAAYALKGKNRIVICYVGDGASSEGDMQCGLNFAATRECPVIFYVRNNGFAISTKSREQYRGDGIGIRGVAFGMNVVRVDGNDLFAVYNATKMAKEYCLKEQKPVLIEALCYRVSEHSASDDSSSYRTKQEINWWRENNWPITRVRKYIKNKGIWSDEKDKAWMRKCADVVMDAFRKTEKTLLPGVKNMLTDVYKDPPKHMSQQMKEFNAHLAKYKENYPVSKYTA